jgi:hypothetical protein
MSFMLPFFLNYHMRACITMEGAYKRSKAIEIGVDNVYLQISNFSLPPFPKSTSIGAYNEINMESGSLYYVGRHCW